MKWRRRGNGAYWIDGVEEAHRQMVPDQGNLTRNIIVIQKMIKSLSALYFQQIVSCGRAKIIVIVIFKKILLEMIISDDDEA